MNLKLVNVYDYPLVTRQQTLYTLLSERTPEQSISHKILPRFEDHCVFVESRPYLDWQFIARAEGEILGAVVGAIYLSKQREIGIAIFRQAQGNGYATWAPQKMLAKHDTGERFLANVAPGNVASHKFFQKHGFKQLQVTYVRES